MHFCTVNKFVKLEPCDFIVSNFDRKGIYSKKKRMISLKATTLSYKNSRLRKGGKYCHVRVISLRGAAICLKVNRYFCMFSRLQ